MVYTIHIHRPSLYMFTQWCGEGVGCGVGAFWGGRACISSIHLLSHSWVVEATTISYTLPLMPKRRHRIRYKFCYNIIMLSEYKTSSYVCVFYVPILTIAMYILVYAHNNIYIYLDCVCVFSLSLRMVMGKKKLSKRWFLFG